MTCIWKSQNVDNLQTCISFKLNVMGYSRHVETNIDIFDIFWFFVYINFFRRFEILRFFWDFKNFQYFGHFSTYSDIFKILRFFERHCKNICVRVLTNIMRFALWQFLTIIISFVLWSLHTLTIIASFALWRHPYFSIVPCV